MTVRSPDDVAAPDVVPTHSAQRTQFVHLRQPTISVLCPTRHPAEVVEAALAPLRSVVDEIVVAASVVATPQQVAGYASVADRVIRYEHSGANRSWSWLVNQAHGDWILMIDGDELPSQAFLDALPELVRDRRVSQYMLPIHWPWPTGELAGAEHEADYGRIVDEPWASDERLRLMRNDFRTPFRPELHRINEPVGPVVYREDLPFLHLDFVLTDEASRRAKVAEYDTFEPPFLNPQGEPFNADLYLPERRGHAPRVVPMAPADLARVRAVASAEPALRDDAELDRLPLADAATIDAAVGDQALITPGQRGTLAIQSLPHFTAGVPDNTVWVRVEHHGTRSWPGELYPGRKIRIGVRLTPADSGPAIDIARAAFPYRLDPGEALTMPINVPAPASAGSYRLALDFVDDLQWLGCEEAVDVEVDPSPSDELARAAALPGGLAPVAAVAALRRRVARTEGLNGRGGAASSTDRIAAKIRAARPQTVAGLGIDPELVMLLALLFRELGDGGRVVAINDDPAATGQLDLRLREAGLRDHVELPVVPVAAVPGATTPAHYELTPVARELLRVYPPEFAIVAGPPFPAGAPDLLGPYLSRPIPLLLCGALADRALLTAEAWQARPDVTVHGLRPTADGLLEATLVPIADGDPA